MNAEVRKEDVADLLPAGYTPEGRYGNSTADIGVHVLTCESFILDNRTVLPSVSFVQTIASVGVNESLEAGLVTHFYAFEMFATNHTLRELLNGIGFRVNAAGVSIVSDETGIQVDVEVDGSLWYRLSGNNVGDPDGETSATMRTHQVGEADQVLWIENAWEDRHPSTSGPGRIQAMRGVLRTVPPGDVAGFVGTSQLSAFHGVWSFGKL